ncbi:hypothetical protein IEO21_08511 [Rhodonia placenta]|uniref:Fungal-type protein kinase domain-containing protein n=1 Tax=Rhodonia placenta TaxID=104341 RepID=A0A8H7NW94_9APHY|nr:hypothetical protein IEO21_08511 [Postia placenta]
MRNTEGLYIADENVGDDAEQIPFMPADYLDIINGDVEYEAHHDLESLYWLLVWIVLRHTDHDHPKGNRACGLLFTPGDLIQCRASKRAWLSENAPVSIRGNAPLTGLLHKVTRMCDQNLLHRERERIPLTHEAFLGAMQAAHREDGWPLNDDMLPWVPPEPAGDTEDSDWDNDSVIVLCTSDVDEENVESRGASRDAGLPTASEVDNQLDAQVHDVTDDLRRWALDW